MSSPITATSPPTGRYAAAKIYKIVCTLPGHGDALYVGSTISSLSKRWHAHKRNCADLGRNSRLYATMRHLGVRHFRLVQVEAYPCRNRDELRAREEHWRVTLEAGLNTNRAHVTQEEAREEKLERDRQYHAANRERILPEMRARTKAIREVQRAIGYPCAACSYTFTHPGSLKTHLSTRRHQVAAMKAHLTALMSAARAAHHARTVAAFQTRLTTALVATAAERDAHRSQLTT